MSISKDYEEDFCHPKILNEIDIKPNYLKYNDRISHCLNIAAVFAVNYVATVKGTSNDFEKTEKMVFDKKLEIYEKKNHPVYLKFIHKENSALADLVLQRMSSKTNRTVVCTSVKIDSKSSSYFYLGAEDALNAEKNRILVFSIIHSSILKDIRQHIPEFGSSKDMQQHGYYVPNDLALVVRHIQLYCLPDHGYIVKEMREKMSSPLKRIFSKKGSISRISLRNNGGRTSRTKINSENSPNHHPKTCPNGSVHKSKSIESLLLSNADSKHLAVNFYVDQKSNSHNDLQNSISTHSSFADDKSNDSSNPLVCGFENVLHDKKGLKYFKDFLTKEVSYENILFWEAVREFTKIENANLRKTMAAKIFYTYMDEKSETPVNLECDVVESARRLLNEPQIDMFNAASNHIFYLMKTDSYNRFRQSKYFELWHEDYKDNYGLKHASSTSSLSRVKKRTQFLPGLFKGKKDKQKKDDSRKSSQTLDSDSSTSNLLPTCKITLYMDEIETHCVTIHSNKKLIQELKKIDKRFHENEFVAFYESDNRIVQFSESMLNLVGQKLVVEKSVVIRVGYVQINMDINLLEYVWFVIRPRCHLGLSHALDPVAKRVGIGLGQCVVVKEEDSSIIEWGTQIYLLNKCCMFLVDQNIFRRAKFYSKSSCSTLDALWKKIIAPDTFLSTLPFDDDNIIESRHDIFSKFKLEPRKVGYLMAGDFYPNSQLELTITRANRNSYDDQRGVCTESQLQMPDFLKVVSKTQSVESLSLSSNRFSEILCGDSDLSFSEIDESSIPSPSNLEVVSDIDITDLC